MELYNEPCKELYKRKRSHFRGFMSREPCRPQNNLSKAILCRGLADLSLGSDLDLSWPDFAAQLDVLRRELAPRRNAQPLKQM